MIKTKTIKVRVSPEFKTRIVKAVKRWKKTFPDANESLWMRQAIEEKLITDEKL